MKPAWSRRTTSSLMTRLLSSFILLGFCFIGLASGLMESLWQMTSGSIPDISVGDHANTSEIFDKNCLNNVFSWGYRFEQFRGGYRWHGSTLNDSCSSSVLLSRFHNSMGESGSRLSPYCDCYWSAIISTSCLHESLLGPAWEVFCTQPDLFRPTVASVLAIIRSPHILAIPDGVGHFSSWWWMNETALITWIHGILRMTL